MTIFRIQFAGRIVKAEHKTAAGKSIAEVSICKKDKQKDNTESFTWLRITIWEPAQFQAPKLIKGSFIAGSGEFKLRSYEKDGVKGTSAECRCTSFDVEVSDGSTATGSIEYHAQKPYDSTAKRAGDSMDKEAGSLPIGGSKGDDEPPFMRLGEFE